MRKIQSLQNIRFHQFNRKRAAVWMAVLFLLALAPKLIYAANSPRARAKGIGVKPANEWLECDRWKRRYHSDPSWLVDGEDGRELKDIKYLSKAFLAINALPAPPTQYLKAHMELQSTLRTTESLDEFKEAFHTFNKRHGITCKAFGAYDLFYAIANEEAVADVESYRVKYAGRVRELAMNWIVNVPTTLELAMILSLGENAMRKQIIDGTDAELWSSLHGELIEQSKAFAKKAGTETMPRVDQILMGIIKEEITLTQSIAARLLPSIASISPKR